MKNGMADAKTAVDFVMLQEDSTLSGKLTVDRGGRTRFGIAEKYHPELTATGFYGAMPNPQAQAIAEETMELAYWDHMDGGAIVSQYFANRLLSFCVNEGTETTVLLLQKSLNALGARLAVDGEPGPETVAAINSACAAQQAALMVQWRDTLTAHYRAIAEANPAQAGELKGWLNRVAA